MSNLFSSAVRAQFVRLLVTASIWTVLQAGSVHAGQTLTVDAANGRYPSIGAALKAAKPGDTVVVKSGSYAEDLRIPTGVTLKGDGAVTIKSERPISVVNAKDVVLRGILAVSDAPKEKKESPAIAIVSSSNVLIADSRTESANGMGIYVTGSKNVKFETVSAIGNGQGNGLVLNDSDVTVSGSIFSSHRLGIMLHPNSRAHISHSFFDATASAIMADESEITVKDNSITGAGGGSKNRGIGIGLRNSKSLVRNNAVRRFGLGIQIIGGQAMIRNNVVSQNNIGMVLSAMDVKVALNTVNFNRAHGIVVVGSKAIAEAGKKGNPRPDLFGNAVSANGGNGISVVNFPDSRIHMNLVEGNGAGIHVENARADVLNNTVVLNSAEGISGAKTARGLLKANNIAFNEFGIRKGPDASMELVSNNVYGNFARKKFPLHDGNYARSEWVLTSSGESLLTSISPADDIKGKTDISVDPGFVETGKDYRLSPGSPLAKIAPEGRLIGAFPVAQE